MENAGVGSSDAEQSTLFPVVPYPSVKRVKMGPPVSNQTLQDSFWLEVVFEGHQNDFDSAVPLDNTNTKRAVTEGALRRSPAPSSGATEEGSPKTIPVKFYDSNGQLTTQYAFATWKDKVKDTNAIQADINKIKYIESPKDNSIYNQLDEYITKTKTRILKTERESKTYMRKCYSIVQGLYVGKADYIGDLLDPLLVLYTNVYWKVMYHFKLSDRFNSALQMVQLSIHKKRGINKKYDIQAFLWEKRDSIDYNSNTDADAIKVDLIAQCINFRLRIHYVQHSNSYQKFELQRAEEDWEGAFFDLLAELDK